MHSKIEAKGKRMIVDSLVWDDYNIDELDEIVDIISKPKDENAIRSLYDNYIYHIIKEGTLELIIINDTVDDDGETIIYEWNIILNTDGTIKEINQ